MLHIYNNNTAAIENYASIRGEMLKGNYQQKLLNKEQNIGIGKIQHDSL